MESLIPNVELSDLKTVGSKFKTNFDPRARKGKNSKIALLENGILWTSKGRQTETEPRHKER